MYEDRGGDSAVRGPVGRGAGVNTGAPWRSRYSGGMKGAWANVDGWVGPAQEARVSPVDAGFLYGEAVYENLRTYGHVPFLFPRHLARLRRSAEFLGIPLEVPDAEITDRLRATQEAAGITGEHSLRVILTAGPQGGEPSLIILVRPLPPLPVDPEREGVGVLLSDWVRAAPGGLPADVKSTNLLAARLAVREAEAEGAHEAVLTGSDGDLTEGATSNLFLVEDGVVLTPPLEDGLLPGITRALVLEVLRELEIPFEETALGPGWLATADEVFLTSSSREVLPVTWSVTPGEPRRRIGDGKPGPLTLRALAGYRRAVQRLLGESLPDPARGTPP